MSQLIPGMVEEVENKWVEGYSFYNKIMVSMYMGELEESRVHLKESAEHMAKSFPERRGMDSAHDEFFQGIVDIQEGKLDSAKTRLEKINSYLEEDVPDWVEYLSLILDAHLAQAEGRYDEALSLADRALSMQWPYYRMTTNWLLFVNSSSAKELLAQIYQAMGEQDKAIAAYENITAFDPESDDRSLIHPSWHYKLAKLYEKMGENNLAIARYDKFLTLWKNADPGLPEVADAKERVAALKQNQSHSQLL